MNADGSDFTSASEVLRFEPLMNDSRLCLVVPVVNDPVLEEEQTFSVVLSTADSDVMPQSNPAVVTIVDNDGIFANHSL